MKKIFIIFTTLFPLAGNCAWIDSKGNPVPNTDSMKSAGDFGVQLILTPDEKEFRHIWNSTTGTPKVVSTNKVNVGSSIGGVLVFSGCKAGRNGACNVSVEFFLEAPNGALTPAGGGPVWSLKPPQPRVLMLGQASVTVGFDKSDALGTYKLIANVTDKISRQTLRLSSPFKLGK